MKKLILTEFRVMLMVEFMWMLFGPYKAHLNGLMDVWMISTFTGVGMLLMEYIETLRKKTDILSSYKLLIAYDAIFVTSVFILLNTVDDKTFIITISVLVMPYGLIYRNFNIKYNAYLGSTYSKWGVEVIKTKIERKTTRVGLLGVLTSILVSNTLGSEFNVYMFIVIGYVQVIYGLYILKHFNVK